MQSITVTRLEVIDHTKIEGDRAYTKWETKPFEVEFSIQDNGRTLKLFLEPAEADNRDWPWDVDSDD